MDHFFQIQGVGEPEEPMLEAYSALSYLAAVTERPRLGALVTGVHLAPGEMSARDVIEHCRALAEAGIEHAIFNMPNVHEIAPLETFGREIIPAVAEFTSPSA